MVEKKNVHGISLLFKDICTIVYLSKMFVVGKQPNFIVFHFESTKILKKILDQEQM